LNTSADFSLRMMHHMPQADELAGRVIAITGAGSGIGRAVALAAAAHGAEVILIGRTVKKLEAVHAEIGKLSGMRAEAVIAPLDLGRALAGDYDQLAAATAERFGRLDGLLHNAAMLGTLAPVEHYDVPTWCRVLHVNVTAAFVLTQVLLPLLRASKDASLIYTSSAGGRQGTAYWGAYAVSKFAIEGLNQVLADECASQTNLRVNALNPGRTRTALRRAAYPSEDLATLPEPEALVNSYLWLLGPASHGVTGQSLDCQARYPIATPTPG
jgi:NAD(P)-dependent dehydrogenase (short-subunit alcohol dehydrogenase family)